MSFRRLLSALVLTALAGFGLTACQTHVGLAAAVDGTRLSDSQLADFVQAGASSYVDSNSGSTVVPKLYALQIWLQTELIDRTVSAQGGDRTAAETRVARSAVLGGTSQDAAERAYIKQGYTSKFGDLAVDQLVALVVLVERVGKLSAAKALQALNNTQTQQLAFAAVVRHKATVVVSKRYGIWQQKQLSLSSSVTAGAPAFVKFPATTTTAG